ncbi:MAG: lysine-2,3-aminomutase-like protein [Deferrisomatales bacterium]
MTASSAAPGGFPERWPREYRELSRRLGPGNPLERMGVAHPDEAMEDPEGFDDPTGDLRLRPLPFLVRKHRDRALLLATGRCYFYCRFCFRRGAGSGAAPPLRPLHWEQALEWVAGTPEVEEVILSGGDPLTLPNRLLGWVGRRLAQIPHLRRWRIHTRAPVVLPARVDRGLLAALESPLPLRVVLHANHPAELRPALHRAAADLRAAGAETLCQSVLLRGVNDRADVLLALFRGLGAVGIRPYYLHHPDRAAGNVRFRLSLAHGRRLQRDLLHLERTATDTFRIPPYVVDLPNGAGKCRVESLVPIAEERGMGGRRVRYRWVRPSGWDALVPDGRCEWWDLWQPASG